MDEKTLFARALQQATLCVKEVQKHQLNNDTPCDEWDLHALLNHLVYELLWVPEITRGKTIAEIGNRYDHDLLGSDHLSAWQHAADGALVAVKQADPKAIAHLSYGDVPMSQYITEMASDIFIHTWDVSQSMMCTLTLDEEIAEVIYKVSLPRINEMARSGVFGEPKIIDGDATIQEKLLALYGRHKD